MGANLFLADAEHLRFTTTGMAVIAKVWNTAAETAIIDWSFQVVLQDGTKLNGKRSEIPPAGLTLRGSPDIFIAHSESLGLKTETQPVPAIPITGRVLFYVPVSKAKAELRTTKWIVGAQDIHERWAYDEQIVGNWVR